MGSSASHAGSKKPLRERDRARHANAGLARPDSDANKKPENAAARRATRQPPLGEPPLVVTTHAVTSFTTRFPLSRGSPASSESGLSSVALRWVRPEPDGAIARSPDTPNIRKSGPGSTGWVTRMVFFCDQVRASFRDKASSPDRASASLRLPSAIPRRRTSRWPWSDIRRP